MYLFLVQYRIDRYVSTNVGCCIGKRKGYYPNVPLRMLVNGAILYSTGTVVLVSTYVLSF